MELKNVLLNRFKMVEYLMTTVMMTSTKSKRNLKTKIHLIKFRFIFIYVVLFKKIVNSLVPIKLLKEFVVFKASDVRFTRSTQHFMNSNDKTMFRFNIKPNCNSFENCFFYRAIFIWNKLPFTIRQVPQYRDLNLRSLNFYVMVS